MRYAAARTDRRTNGRTVHAAAAARRRPRRAVVCCREVCHCARSSTGFEHLLLINFRPRLCPMLRPGVEISLVLLLMPMCRLPPVWCGGAAAAQPISRRCSRRHRGAHHGQCKTFCKGGIFKSGHWCPNQWKIESFFTVDVNLLSFFFLRPYLLSSVTQLFIYSAFQEVLFA